MSTFGTWLGTQVDAPGPVGRFAKHTLGRDGCDTCLAKENGEEAEWGIAEVVRDMDAHRAVPEMYEFLDLAVAEWSSSRRPQRR